MAATPKRRRAPVKRPRKNAVHALSLPAERSLPTGIKDVFMRCREKLGFVPNVLRSYTLRPAKFEHFRGYNNELMLGESGLTKLEREIIAVVVSSANHCHYCIVAHGAAVRYLSGDARFGDTLAINYREAGLDARQRAMCDFAWKLTTAPHTMGEPDRDALRAAGFSDEDIFDITEVAGFYNMSNRIASGVGMKPNDEYYTIGR